MKANQKVLSLSCKHKNVNVEQLAKGATQTIVFYNNIKCVVDVLLQTAKKYAAKTGYRRWPLQMLYNTLHFIRSSMPGHCTKR